MPEASHSVTFDDHSITCTTPAGETQTITWSDLQIVILATTDDGPFLPDVFWLLGNTELRCVIPQDAIGGEEFLARLQKLPNFDNEAVIQAMNSTENAHFMCWRKL